MKRLIASFLSVALLLATGISAFAEELSGDGYRYTSDGTLTNAYEYLDDEYIFVSSEIDGTCIKHIGDRVFSGACGTDTVIDEGIQTIVFLAEIRFL